MRTSQRNRRRMIPAIDQMESRELLSTMVGPAPRAAVPRRADTVTGLHLVTSPTVNRSFLTATTAITANDIWAVGFTDSGTFAEHFNGTSFTVVPTPTPAGSVGAQLLGVTATASNNVWAVGENVTHDSAGDPIFSPLIEHFDGTSWSIIASPSLASQGLLNGVTAIAADNIWAVGSLGHGRGGNLIEHFDGTSWSVVTAPSLSSRDALLSISGTSSHDIWAVGETVIPRRRRFCTSTAHSGAACLSRAAAPDLCHDACFERRLGGHGGTVDHFDGTSWSVVPAPSGPGHKRCKEFTGHAWQTTASSSGSSTPIQTDGRRGDCIPAKPPLCGS